MTPTTSEAELQYRLARWRNLMNHELIVPNSQLYGWDADLLSVTKAGMVYEHEIKVTRQDFRNEMKAMNDGNFSRAKFHKHDRLKKKSTKVPRPNYLYYVVPVTLLEADDIRSLPPYAGLIYYMPLKYEVRCFEIIITPPRIHDDSITHAQIRRLAKSLEYRFWRRAAQVYGGRFP